MVISAFASELYLKSFLVFEGKTAPKWHYLHDLFKELSQENQQDVERKWDLVSRDREEILKGLDLQEEVPIPRDLHGALKEGNEGFEQLRYIYEAGKPFRFVLSDFPLVLRRTILDLQPTWGRQDEKFLGRSSADPVPVALKEGSITFWLRHPDPDWITNDKHCTFTPMKDARPHSVACIQICGSSAQPDFLRTTRQNLCIQ